MTTDIMSVLLASPRFPGISQKELAQWIEAKKKCRDKLPIWFATPKIYYPDKANIEQCSSQATAIYKAGLVHGNSLIDLSGGLGVDSYFFAENMGQVTHCELDRELAQIAAHNFKVLGRDNILCLPGDGIQVLERSPKTYDWIYADPSRRSDKKGKVFLLEDCLPNIPKHLDLLLSRSANILIKCSPMLDIQSGARELRHVREVQVVAREGEVKELLFLLERGYSGDLALRAVDLARRGERSFAFSLAGEQAARARLATPATYLYEPNAAILKAGGFKSIALAYDLGKLHPHSHLYTSDRPIDFPGRRFHIKACLPYSKRTLAALGAPRANIATRNFPLSVAELRKRHKIADGGEVYLFFTTGPEGGLIVLSCVKA